MIVSPDIDTGEFEVLGGSSDKVFPKETGVVRKFSKSVVEAEKEYDEGVLSLKEFKRRIGELERDCGEDLKSEEKAVLSLFGQLFSLVDWKKTEKVTDSEHRRLGNIWQWPYDLDDTRFVEEFGTTKDTSSFTMPMVNCEGFYSNETKNMIDEKLKTLEYKTNWKFKPMNYYDD